MSKAQKIREYLKAHPELLNKDYQKTALKFNSNYEAVRALARKVRKENTPQLQQPVKTPEGYTGTLVRGKTWQLPNGEWRESLTFETDKLQQWTEFKENFLKDIEEIIDNKNIEPIPVREIKGNSCLEISLPDLHFGKGDINELEGRFIKTVMGLLSKAQVFGIERILLPIGNDGLNSEGKRYTTTGGTPQHDSVDWQTSFRVYWKALCAIIDWLSNYYPVDVVVISGNHDMERMFYVGDVIQSFFRNNPNVTVNNNGEYRKYYEFGVNMLMFTHGDKEKTADLPLIMATEQPEMFARTKVREAHLGHFHKEMIQEYRGIKTRFIPSICQTDDWHKMMGYNHMKAAQAFIWGKETGLDGFFQINHL